MGLLDQPRKNPLRDDARKRERNALAMDSARPYSVGAPGGLLGQLESAPQTNYLRNGLLGTSFLPGIGDAAGLLSDAYMYTTEPESRNPLNYAISALGTLPFVPGAAIIREIPAPAWNKHLRGQTVPVGDHPTLDELHELMDIQNDYLDHYLADDASAIYSRDALRALGSPEVDYVWPSSMALHDDVKRALSLTYPESAHGQVLGEQLGRKLKLPKRR